MSLALILAGGGILGLSGVPGLALSWRSRWGQWIATLLAVVGSTFGILGSTGILVSGQSASLTHSWSLPGAAWELSVDPLGAFFLVPVFLMGALGSIYAVGYWRQREHPGNARRLRFFWGTVMAGMVVLILARNAILFLLGWEFMALSGFFMVGTEDHLPEVRRASWIYFVSTHVATLTLFGLFVLLRQVTGSFQLRAIAVQEAGLGTLYGIFFLALFGFGLKAGLMPLHVWLPDAHANAPSHVSALLSGIMLKMGVYGLIRITGYLPSPPISWGALLLLLGSLSGILGIAFAIGQRDLKRLLAYSSVENIGIIFMGMGLAMVGRSTNRPDWILLGMAGCLLHVWNHSLFKPLLFMSAGSVVHAVGTREIDRMGGLSRALPRTYLLFLVGSVAIAGLPPLNGFVSEIPIYIGLFRALPREGSFAWAAIALAAPALALIGALAVACFVKVTGAVFLGSPRIEPLRPPHESPSTMTGPMAALAACCIAISFAAPALAPILDRVIGCWLPGEHLQLDPLLSLVPFARMSIAGMALTASIGVAVLTAEVCLRPGRVPKTGTWDCGYARPSSRMQYTSSSFADMLVGLFRGVLRPKTGAPALGGLFPEKTRFHRIVEDVVLHRFILPAAEVLKLLSHRLRVIQRGQMRNYVFYIFAAVVALLMWTLPVGRVFVRFLSR
jgi:hydrogenase-4 component B